ncbi:hypothetical protein DQ384_25580 [Sphaerisporangium album]|uniref:Molecular chaperone n=1 Tax=Sphaerisporangium album TaxID=509200 RepID=A0A367FBZ7_9ACTN|nr:hypothetical protein [Sphaerisporangium album]RCG27896.1 hypothetical protein DQ384_25580 [Sphaerisporangium album]
MLLELSFETPGEHVQVAATGAFRLYETHGFYVLPDVVLFTGPAVPKAELQEAAVVKASGATPDQQGLADTIRSAWNDAADRADVWETGRSWVSGRRELATRVVVSAGLPVFGPGASPEAVVTWRYVYTDVTGVSASNDVRVRLVFMPVGVQPPPPAPEEGASRRHKPTVLRVRGEDEKDYTGFAVVDFGTSSSAVALYDSRYVNQRAIDVGQAAKLREKLAGLLRAAPPSPLDAPWRDLLRELVETVRPRAGNAGLADAAALADRLEGRPVSGGGGTDPLLDEVCLVLEKSLAACGTDLAEWFAPRLLECFDRAFTVPNLEELQIREVVFDPDKDLRERPSSIRVTNENPVEIELSVDGQGVRRDLKNYLFESELLPGMTVEDGREATTDDLIARVYRILVEATENFARDGDEKPVERLINLVATYPTTTPPSARRHLHDLLEVSLDLKKVVIDFDEGVAAGLYFLMRDFGSGRLEFGAEAIRARARLVSEDPPTWRQNMLLVDIGAGTTDIALIGLTLQDITPEHPDSLVRGRLYILRPEVLNSTGHAQLGGNYLTLRVFYWIKAALLDSLLSGPGDEQTRRRLADRVFGRLRGKGTDQEQPRVPLAPLVVGSDAEDPVPEEIGNALTAGLPTSWHRRQEGWQKAQDAFQLLWNLAESAKIKMSGTEDEGIDLGHTALQDLLLAVDAQKVSGLPKLSDLLPKTDLRLSRADFETLLRPALQEAAELAAWLVRTTSTDSEDAALDRVMLSGKTSKMPLLSRVVTDVLAHGEERLPWNPSELAVESERAKQAASLGACWAQAIRERGTGGGESELDRGRTWVNIDVENLFHSLPCGFQLKLTARQSKTLLWPGTKMIEVDDRGTLAARAAQWQPMIPNFEIHRPTGWGRTIQWGVFRTYNYQDRGGYRPDRTIFEPSSDGTRPALVRAQLEVDQSLTPYLHLSHGPAHYHVGMVPNQVIELREALGASFWSTEERRLRELPATVCVVAADADGSDGAVELFPQWRPAAGDEATGYFTRFFHDEPHLESPAVPGVISAPLPAPSSEGDYRFFLRRPDGKEEELDTLHVIGRRGPVARYVATLDVRGRLRLHRGEPRYWEAGSVRDVERTPGSVLRVPMEPGEPELRPERNPFNGRH